MQGRGVIVKYSQLVDGARQDLSCSGMYLGRDIVLTHGTLLVDLLKDKKAEAVVEELSTRGCCATTGQKISLLNSVLENVKAECEIIVPSKTHPRQVFSIDSEPCASTGLESFSHHQTDAESQSESLVPHTESDGFLTAGAHINRIVLQPGLHRSLDSLMPASKGWKLSEENQSCMSPNVEKVIMSAFVVLTLSEQEQITEGVDTRVVEAAREVLAQSIPVKKGNFVYIESTPFGSVSPSIFLNSLSHGIICNSSPRSQDIVLTDARCITGSEGAPVFVLKGGQRWLCALVISPFCWRGGEWLGLTLLASLRPVLQTLIKSCNASASSSLPLPNTLPAQNKNFPSTTHSTTATDKLQAKNKLIDGNFLEELLSDVSKSVVCIQSGESWGSGLVISSSPGIILTCAHVTYKATDKEVNVLLSDGRRTRGTVIYQTRPLTIHSEGQTPESGQYSMWDLAVVVTSSPLTQALTLARTLPPQGIGVVAGGYGLFPPHTLPTPTLSRGVISKVVTLPSSSIHLPLPRQVSNGSKQTQTASNCGNNPSLDGTKDGTSRKCLTTSRHECSNVEDVSKGDTDSQMKQSRRPSRNAKRCVPVPVVMQTTCAVYAGSSGGPVVAVHPVHGVQVVGLVVCNMQDSSSITFPHVNLAIPIPAIAAILNTFMKTQDASVLQYLDVECAAAASLWGLTHPSSRSRL